jgi:hypothetical protein
VVGAQKFYASGATTVNTTFEFDIGGRWFLINLATKAKDGAKTIVGFRVVPEAFSAIYGPWMVSASVPLGALAFLIYRGTRRMPEKAA